MTLPVVVGPRADAQIDQAFAWWAKHRSADQANQWLQGILAAIEGICENPARYSKYSESQRFPFDVREMHFGLGRRVTHRVLFTVRPECIYVLMVLHLARDAVGPDDL